MSRLADFSNALQRSIRMSETENAMLVAVSMFSDLTIDWDGNDVLWMLEQAKGIKPKADIIIDIEIQNIKATL